MAHAPSPGNLINSGPQPYSPAAVIGQAATATPTQPSAVRLSGFYWRYVATAAVHTYNTINPKPPKTLYITLTLNLLKPYIAIQYSNINNHL